MGSQQWQSGQWRRSCRPQGSLLAGAVHLPWPAPGSSGRAGKTRWCGLPQCTGQLAQQAAHQCPPPMPTNAQPQARQLTVTSASASALRCSRSSAAWGYNYRSLGPAGVIRAMGCPWALLQCAPCAHFTGMVPSAPTATTLEAANELQQRLRASSDRRSTTTAAHPLRCSCGWRLPAEGCSLLGRKEEKERVCLGIG